MKEERERTGEDTRGHEEEMSKEREREKEKEKVKSGLQGPPLSAVANSPMFASSCSSHG
jgi:hypothetical protein